MLERPMIVAAGDRHSREELVLHRDRLFPIRRTGQAGIELRAAGWQTEIVVACRTDDLVELHVAARVEDRAVAVEIAPGPRVGLSGERIDRRGQAERLLANELADRGLERRLAGSKEIVGRAEADRPILPARHA